MTNTLIRVRRSALLIGAVFIISVVGHFILARTSWLESIYWTVITISTVGYSYETPQTINRAEQLLTIFVILVGTVTVAYTLGMLLQAAVEGQIQKALGVRRMTRQIEKLADHVIICGFGRIGQNLADRLAQQDVPFLIVELQPEALAEAEAHDYLVLEGDATDEEVLRLAKIEKANTVVVALQSDADNVFLTLTARNMNPDLRILARGELPGTERKLRQAGANEVVLPAVIGAHRIADLIIRPHAADVMQRVGDVNSSMEAIVAEIFIPNGSQLIGKTIREAGSGVRNRLLIVSVRNAEGAEVFNPSADYQFADGDCIVAMGEPAAIEEFRGNYIADS